MQKGRPHRNLANNLWIARKRVGYPQKWVASLLGQRSTSIISEYERGIKLPTLPTALKLELIYRTPLSELFPDLHVDLTRAVAGAKDLHIAVRRRDEEVRQKREDTDAALRQDPSDPATHGAIHSSAWHPKPNRGSSRSLRERVT